jgi:uncharacterized protein YqfB (UPF0267 family)
MIFQYTWQKVLAGVKTQTRRVAKNSEALWATEQAGPMPEKVVRQGNRVKWRTGGRYAVQPGRNQKGRGRIELLDIRYQHLGNVTEEEAKAEGFSSLAEFIQAWTEIHGRFDPEQPVWVLEFRLAE